MKVSRLTTLFGGFIKPEAFFNKLCMNCLPSDPKDARYYERIKALWVLEREMGCRKEDFLKKGKLVEFAGVKKKVNQDVKGERFCE